MKRAFYPFLAGCLLLAALSAKGHGQVQEPRMGVVDEEPLVKFDFRLNNGTIDNHIVELARQADANFIADATHFPEQSEPLSTSSNDYLGHFILVLAQQRNLTWMKHGKRTFLFWADQDLVPLARMILAEEEARTKDKPRTAEESVGAGDPYHPQQRARWYKEMAPALNDYFKRAHGWDGISQDFKLDIKMAELPPDLRAKVVARAREELQNPAQMALYRNWFGDEAWRRARLKTTRSLSGANLLTILLFDPEGPGTLFGIGDFDLQKAGVRP